MIRAEGVSIDRTDEGYVVVRLHNTAGDPIACALLGISAAVTVNELMTAQCARVLAGPSPSRETH